MLSCSIVHSYTHTQGYDNFVLLVGYLFFSLLDHSCKRQTAYKTMLCHVMKMILLNQYSLHTNDDKHCHYLIVPGGN